MSAENHSQIQWLVYRENLTDFATANLEKAKRLSKKFKPVKVPGDPFNTIFYPRPDRKKVCVKEYQERRKKL